MPSNKQQGAILLIMMLIFITGLASVLLLGLDKASQNLNNQEKTNKVLASAKNALINYALINGGRMPCPDADGDGQEDACGADANSVEGWLPWQTLRETTLRDSTSNCLRYVVSGNYKTTSTTSLVASPATEGHFVIHDQYNNVRIGNTSAEYGLAVVLAGHDIVDNQSRGLGGGTITACGSTTVSAAANRATNHLETSNGVNNASGEYTAASIGSPGGQALPNAIGSVFIQSPESNGFNDVLTVITPQDFSTVMANLP